MLLTSIVRQSVTKRIPLIKFRRQRQEEATLHVSRSGSATHQTNASTSAAGFSVSLVEYI